MEARGWLGIPFLAWAALCLVVALIWVFVWPADRAQGATGLGLFLLRWGHALVWLLLATTCLMKGSGNAAVAGWGNVVALTSLFVYLSFLGATFVFN